MARARAAGARNIMGDLRDMGDLLRLIAYGPLGVGRRNPSAGRMTRRCRGPQLNVDACTRGSAPLRRVDDVERGMTMVIPSNGTSRPRARPGILHPRPTTGGHAMRRSVPALLLSLLLLAAGPAAA